MSSLTSFWDALDAVLVINLDHRADRWAQMQAHLATFAPMEKVHRLSAVRGVDLPGYGDKRWFGRTKRPTTWAGRAGCTLSHRNALRLMVEKGWQRMLILEDDARFVAPVAQAAGAILAGHWAGQANQAGVCFLGFTEPHGPVSKVLDLPEGGVLCRIGGCLTTHAYVVNQAGAQAILAQLPTDDQAVWPWLARHKAIDAWYARHLAGLCGVTAVSPVWVEQEESISDITNRAGGTAQGGIALAELKGSGACARFVENITNWFKWRMREARGF